MIWPGPGKISDFNSLPNSEKSQLEGDTIQIPNVAGYFSNNYRNFAVRFYQQNFYHLAILPLPPYRLNYPPEYSFVAIKKHTDSTYLEELVYPLKASLFVNGFEPFNSDSSPKFWGSTRFVVPDKTYFTKVTLRYYPSNLIVRMIVWMGIVSSILLLYRLSKKVLF